MDMSIAISGSVAETICSCVTAYNAAFSERLQKQAYFDSDGQFDVSAKLCFALNNRFEMRRKLQEMLVTEVLRGFS